MTEAQKQKTKDLLPTIAVITVLLASFGWIFTRLERIDQKLDSKLYVYEEKMATQGERISKIEGQISNYQDILNALNELNEQYKKANKKVNFEGFLHYAIDKAGK